MCGITGLAGEGSSALASRLNQTLEYRGPDDSGEYFDPQTQVVIAMRRLSILNLEGRHQPISNEDDTIWTILNGEIFNSPEMRTRPDDLKVLLRRAVALLLPPELLNAPKHGFVIPDTLWLQGGLRPLMERLARQGILRPEIYEHFVRPHLEGKSDFTGQVWTLLMFQLWHIVFVEEGATALPTFSWRDLA